MSIVTLIHLLRRATRLAPCSGLAAGALTGCGESTGPSVPFAVEASHDSIRVGTLGTFQLTAHVKDKSGRVLQGRTITWTSANADRALVSSTGLVTWGSPGQTVVVAKDGALFDTVKVTTGGDLSIAAVQFTQGVQDAGGTIPLIAQGQPAAVVVMLTSAVQTSSTSSKMVLRLYDALGVVAYADTESVKGTIGATPALDAPNATFLLPAAQLQNGRTWRVVRDPMGDVVDDSSANDVFPRDAPAALALTHVPPFSIRFVPITLTSNGGTTPAIFPSDIPGYMRTVLSSLPLGPVTTSIGDAFATSASFGTPPSGGASSFWQQVLQELDAARVASSDQTSHWYGVVSPPQGFNNTQFGGFGYIPSDPTSSDRFTRTALGVRTGWFFNPTQARDIVAHELGHNFGRRHTPCGNPSGTIDASYPRTDGRLGDVMQDVYGWANGLSTSLAAVSAMTGDIMGYCLPGWSSAYTYKGVLASRGPPPIASVAPREPLLVVQGRIGPEGVVLNDPLALTGVRTDAAANGAYRLHGLDDAGAVVFEQSFDAKEVDHADVRLFTVAVPLPLASRARSLRVSGPSGVAALNVVPAEMEPGVRAEGGNAIAVTCGSTSARVAVQDQVTGELLGIARGELRLAGVRGRRLAVSCASGTMPRQLSVIAP